MILNLARVDMKLSQTHNRKLEEMLEKKSTEEIDALMARALLCSE
jgi:hypothetical protein